MEVSFYLKRPITYRTNDKKEQVKIINPDLTSIYARISYEGKRLKYYIPEKIYPKFWNKETQRAKESKNFREYPEFNTRLNHLESDIRNVFRKFTNDNEGMTPDEETFKLLLDAQIKKVRPVKQTEVTLFNYIEDFIARSKEGTRMNTKTKKPTVKSTNKGFSTVLNHLKEFQKTYTDKENKIRGIDFATIDLDFYNGYVKYLSENVKLRLNTIGDHIKRLKTILNEATDRGINKNLCYKSKYFAKLNEDSTAIYLNESELQELEDLDLSKNVRLDRVRDLFLISCYSGLRFSDYSTLRPDQIKDGFIETTQLKTNEPIIIPIHRKVQKILSKYNGSLPPAISNQKMNDTLKEIGKLVLALNVPFSKTFSKVGEKITLSYKKWELLSTHSGRRSFCTNEFLARTPIQTIMKISGHKSISSFEKYIKLTNADHAKLLKLDWENREKMDLERANMKAG